MAKKKSKPSKGAALTAHKLGFGGLMLCLQLVFTPGMGTVKRGREIGRTDQHRL